MANSLNEVEENHMLIKEKPTIKFAYASVVTTSKIKKGDMFSKKNLWVKRPGTGYFKASELSKILGKKASQDLNENIFLKKNHLN